MNNKYEGLAGEAKLIQRNAVSILFSHDKPVRVNSYGCIQHGQSVYLHPPLNAGAQVAVHLNTSEHDRTQLVSDS